MGYFYFLLLYSSSCINSVYSPRHQQFLVTPLSLLNLCISAWMAGFVNGIAYVRTRTYTYSHFVSDSAVPTTYDVWHKVQKINMNNTLKVRNQFSTRNLKTSSYSETIWNYISCIKIAQVFLNSLFPFFLFVETTPRT